MTAASDDARRPTRPERSRLRGLRLSLPWIAAVIVLAMSWLARGYTADDAFIPGRYALRLVEGHGYTFRDGPPTDGITGPLLLAPELAAASLGVDPVETAKVLGALAAALSAAWVVRRLVQRAGGTAGALFVLLALSASGAFAMHAQSGLETGLAVLVVTGLGLGATSREPSSRRRSWAAVIAGLLLVPWLRPELVPVSWALGALAARRAPEPDRARAAVGVALAAVLGLGSIVAFRLAMFGQAIPLSAQAKPTDLGNGLGYALVALAVLFGLVLVPLLHAARTSRDDGALSLALVISLGTVVLGGGDWMPGGRLLAPLVPLTLLLAGTGFGRFVGTHERRAWIAALGVVAVIPQLALTTLVIEQADDVARSRAHAGRELRAVLARESRVVALVDVGFLSYRASWQPFDLAGVTDPDVGGRPGAHCAKPVSVDDLLARDVDTLVLHSGIEPHVEDGVLTAMRGHPVEQALARDPRVRELFEVVGVLPYATGYYYVVLRRRA